MSAALDLSGASLLEVIEAMSSQLAAGAEVVALRVLDPDFGRGCYAGEPIEHAGHGYVHRPLRVWVELADRLGLRLATPRLLEPPLLELRFERLGKQLAPVTGAGDRREKYGRDSEFARIRRAEEPSFVLDLADALDRVGDLPRDARILSLGVNTGDELALLLELRPPLRERACLVGIDHSTSALARARERFPDPRHRFIDADLATLADQALGRFDLILAINVLQSPGVDDRAVLRCIVQDLLTAHGALVLALPNCRYRDGELSHGARTKNFTQPELSLVIKNLGFYRRYLQQHRRRVFITGSHDLLLTAVVQRCRETL